MTRSRLVGALAPLLLLVVGMAACGGDDEAGSGAAGNGTDRAFVAEMVPHHESAVEMAKVARSRGQHPEVKKLADAIITAQNAEIETMNGLAAQLDEGGVEKGDLGMAAHEMGMSGDTAMLEEAKPFDREFIDMMIPHHQGAIRMARVELEKGENAEAKKLARAIVDAQTDGDRRDEHVARGLVRRALARGRCACRGGPLR